MRLKSSPIRIQFKSYHLIIKLTKIGKILISLMKSMIFNGMAMNPTWRNSLKYLTHLNQEVQIPYEMRMNQKTVRQRQEAKVLKKSARKH